jgi:hypothetical protein
MKNIVTILLSLWVSLYCFSQDQPPMAVNDTFDIYLLDDTVTLNLTKNDYSQDGHPFFLYQAPGSINFTDSTATYFISYSGNFRYNGIRTFQTYVILDTVNGVQLAAQGYIHLRFHNPYYDTLDINRVRARINNNGNHFWDLENSNLYNVPKGSNDKALFCYATWIGGLDENNQLHVAADRYGGFGQDFFPGPVSFANAYNNTYDTLWNKVWKINKTEVDYHKSHWWVTGYQPPAAILNWPGNGNTALGQAAILAPFHDANSNGIYEPMTGDYPLIKGDQSVFFIQNDNRRLHTETQGASLGIEIHGTAYAFNCEADSALLYTTFLHYDIYNRSATTYHYTYLGNFVDTDLGFAWDDYIGCDVSRGSFYGYDGHVSTTKATAISTTILGGPLIDPDNLDNPNLDQFGNIICSNNINGDHFADGIVDNERYGMTSFIYFTNCASGPTCDPQNAAEYYNLLGCKWKDGIHMKYGGNGHPNSGSTLIDCNFMFPDLSDFCNWGTDGVQPPGYITGAGGSGVSWTEENVGNPPDDRRGATQMGPFTFHPGDKQELDIAFVWARDWSDSLPWSAVQLLKTRIDQVHSYYHQDTTPCGGTFTGFAEAHHHQKNLKIYPVPASDQLNIEYENLSGRARYMILGIAGNVVASAYLTKGNLSQISLGDLHPGIYLLVIKDDNRLINSKFIKN